VAARAVAKGAAETETEARAGAGTGAVERVAAVTEAEMEAGSAVAGCCSGACRGCPKYRRGGAAWRRYRRGRRRAAISRR